ncbi:MAG: sulfite exporter TauE/SafE family protein [Halofilum sp. (in: g-proteobacteria)]|nr:sulfite exporter TauE/SafE family protein [Halofilum sp. (in: g-proteobacteria)]
MTGTGADPTLLAAFVAGLVGSSHCLGMCGGIAAALGMGTAGPEAGAGRALGRALLYNGGRIASYAVAGTLAGGIGFILGQAVHAPTAIVTMRVLTGAVLVAIGLQVAFNLRLLRPLETAGMHAWRRVAPLATRLMGKRSAGGTMLLGALWGWMPCGLVYGMLVAAAATGQPLTGAALMAVFGLGTAPGHGRHRRARQPLPAPQPQPRLPPRRRPAGRRPRRVDGACAIRHASATARQRG